MDLSRDTFRAPACHLSHHCQGDKLIDDHEWSFLISGKTLTPVLAWENPAPDWIDARMWNEVQALAGLPVFNGLAETFAMSLLQDFKVGCACLLLLR